MLIKNLQTTEMVDKLENDIRYLSGTYDEIQEALADLDSVLEGFPFAKDFIKIVCDNEILNEKFHQIFQRHQKDILQKAEELGVQESEIEEAKNVFNKYKDLRINCGDWNEDAIWNFGIDLCNALDIPVRVGKIKFV